ncbi:MAG: DUF1287 domain-containing protein [bacterium]|nr:DUF1287 domain-containing protein [bacterium]
MIRKKKVILGICAVVFCSLAGVAYHYLDYYNILPKKSHTAEEFNITTITSSVDFNKNGVDDYTDILLGAKKEAQNHPKYDGTYYVGGYPPDNIGVCTDVVWRSFKNAGYCLKDMVNADIANHTDAYPKVNGSPDPNIDFRRVPNLKMYFERHGITLTLDTDKIEEWQPGDIIVFSSTHIGILSDKRNSDGVPYLIHNSGQLHREEDALLKQKEITGHYRFDASKLTASDLIAWHD